MADQVTISTFLELKDNLSKGLKRIESTLNAIASSANKAKGALDGVSKTTEKMGAGTARSTKIAIAALKEQGKAARETERMQERAAKAQARAADKAVKAQERAKKRQAGGTAGGAWLPFIGATTGISAASAVFDAIGSAVSKATELIVDFNQKVFEAGREYQNTQLRIGMVLVGLNMAPTIRSAKLQANELYSTMRVLARDLPGETQDYVEVFSRALPAALAAGEKNVKKFAELSSQYTAFAFFSGVKDVGQIGRDLEAILRGRAISRTRTFANLQPYMDKFVEAKELKKLRPEERLALVTKAVAKATQGIGDSADTAEAKLGTLNDLITQIYQQGGKPLFDAQLSIISQINKYLIDNNTQINKMVSVISTSLGDAMRGILVTVEKISVKMAEANYSILGAVDTVMKNLGTVGLFYRAAKGAVTSIMEAGAEQRTKEEQERRQKIATSAEEILKKYPDLAAAMPSKAAESADKLKAWAQGLITEKKMPKADWETFLQAQGIPLKKSTEWFAELAPKPPESPKDRTTHKYDFRYSKFDIRQDFAEGFDPDRIAVAFATDLGRLGELKTQAAYAPVYAVGGN